jgi:WD40 repeat protein
LAGYLALFYLNTLSNGCLVYAARDNSNYYILIIDCNNEFQCVKRIEDCDSWTYSAVNLRGGLFATAHKKDDIKIYSIEDDYKCIRTLVGQSIKVSSLVYVNERNLLLSASKDGTINAWDMAEYKLIRRIGNSNYMISNLMLLPFDFVAVLSAQSIKIMSFKDDYDFKCINVVEYDNITFDCILLLNDCGIVLVAQKEGKPMFIKI